MLYSEYRCDRAIQYARHQYGKFARLVEQLILILFIIK